MKKRTAREEAYRIYWALGMLIGRTSGAKGGNEKKIAAGARTAHAAMEMCLASLEPEVETDGEKEENT